MMRGAYACYPQMAYSLRSPLVMIRLAPVTLCDSSYSSCMMVRGYDKPHSGVGHVGRREDAYDGDDVAVFILASVTLLFPLHDWGCE